MLNLPCLQNPINLQYMENELAVISAQQKTHYDYMLSDSVLPTVYKESRENLPDDIIDSSLADVHMHIDNMKGKSWKVPVGEKIVSYLSDKNIVEAGVIFENEDTVINLINSLDSKEVSCSLVPFYFIHDPRNINRRKFDSLYSKGLVKGIKLHPVYDNYQISYENLKEVISLSKEYGSLPLLIHFDDRVESMYLTSPEKIDSLVEEMLDRDSIVPIIIGHSGAYAHPRIVSFGDGKNVQAESYWKKFERESDPLYSRLYLIRHSLQLALQYPFIYLDSSSCVNKNKARIISDAVNRYPDLAKKILLGTDFPVKAQHQGNSFIVGATIQGQLKALWNQGLERDLLLQIALNRIVNTY